MVKARKARRLPQAYRAPAATLFVTLASVAIYFTLSKGYLFINEENFYKFAFGVTQAPGNVVNYLFVHTGPVHLALNMVFLVLYGFLAEQSIQRKNVFAVYLLSGAVGAVAFSLLTPDTVLVGSSTAVYGLFGAAMLVRPRETLSGSVLLTITATYILVPHVTTVEETAIKNTRIELEEVKSEAAAITGKLEDENSKAASAQTEVGRLGEERELLERQPQTSEVVEKIQQVSRQLAVKKTQLTQATQVVERLETERKKIEVRIESVRERKELHEKGLQRESEAPVAVASHAVSSLVGSLYVFFLRRDKVYDLGKIKWLARLLGDSR